MSLPRTAPLRFARSGVDLIVDGDEDVFALANDEALPIDLTEE